MESNKTFVITLILIIIIIACLAGYYFIGMNDNVSFNNIIHINRTNNSTPVNQNTSNNTVSNNEVITPTEFSQVKDYSIYFTINSILNKYYEEITNNNYQQVIGYLDDYYVRNNKITSNTIHGFVKTGYQDISYYSKLMYVKSSGNIFYYFVEGEEQLYNFIEERLTEEEKIAYLVIVDKNNDTFSITPLKTLSFFEYAKNYIVSSNKQVKANAYNSYFKDSIDDEIICSYYINYFKTLLYLNSEKAYNMLESNYKASFEDYEDFVNNLQKIYDRLNPRLLNYSVKGENGKRVYSIINNNNIRIEMTESSILNFKISINEGN